MLTEHPLLSEPSSVSFYNWMSNAVGNRTGAGNQESPVNRSQHNSLQTGQIPKVVLIRNCIFIQKKKTLKDWGTSLHLWNLKGQIDVHASVMILLE